ncbi:site-specific integrase [Spirosoma sp. KNUC1025]|uniref:site-specific integrase n=1 Tax=Spirosoma sp. KNUC1025 TaxID=2894082 RepID=UPI00386B961D|nr:site-specific integrase [Spirosoma sp. KNUC1025]
MSATVNFYFDKRKQKKDGTYPVKLRITYQRQQRYFPTEISLTDAQWEKVCKPKPREDFIRDTKALLDSISNRAERVIRNLPVFSFDEFENRYAGTIDTKSDNVFSLFESYIKQLTAEGRAGTADSYQCAKNALLAYHGRKTPLSFDDVTPQWLHGFETWMLSKKRSITSVGIYLRSLRTIYNLAIEEGLAERDVYPFTKRRYQIPTGRNVKKALVLADIEKIYHYPAEPMSAEERARDLWLFSYLCNGMNPKDICRLTYQQISGAHIRFVRAKTERTKREVKPITISITDDIQRILDNWGAKPATPTSYVFGVLTPGLSAEREMAVIKQFVKTLNKYIRQIAQTVGIDKDVTTYTARHSFSTVLKRSGAPIEFISESLGHQDIRTTESYLDSFEDDVKRQYASVLTGFKNIPKEQ